MKPEIFVDRLDGGLNQSDAPSYIDITESPDCYNQDFGDRGSTGTRYGTSYFNTAAITAAGDGATAYNGVKVLWKAGSQYYMSGTAEVLVTASSGKYSSGTTVVYAQYQDVLFSSDGINGPYRYEGGQSFYNMGIGIPSAPTAVSGAAAAGVVPTGTHYYTVAFVNTHVAIGEIGSASLGVTLATSATVNVSGIPLGSGLYGVAERRVYRATNVTGPYNLVKVLSDNITTSFTDSLSAGTTLANEDGSSPKPFAAIHAFKERLWMPDNDNRTVLRYTDYDNPYVSQAENFLPLNKGGDHADIIAISDQNDLLTNFKDGDALYLVSIEDPADDTTFKDLKSPANVGIVGPKAFTKDDNGIIFCAKRQGKFVGVGYVSGTGLVETQTQFLVNKVISRKIEQLILTTPSSLWSKISIGNYNNRIYIGFPIQSNSTRIDGILFFDVNRIVQDKDTDPGSWSPWSGEVGVNDFFTVDEKLYGISSNSHGKIIEFNNNTYTDADGSAIESYWRSKEIGSDGDLESWVKDFRQVISWVDRLGSYSMRVCVKVDGEQGDGTCYDLDLTPVSSVWDSAIWDVSLWGPGSLRNEIEQAVGPLLGKRIQVSFFNDTAVAGRGFRVNSFKIRFSYRRQR